MTKAQLFNECPILDPTNRTAVKLYFQSKGDTGWAGKDTE
jgi:hypothetical protein